MHSSNAGVNVAASSRAARALVAKDAGGAHGRRRQDQIDDVESRIIATTRPLNVLVVAPTLDAGAASAGTVDLVHMLAAAGHQPVVVSRGGRREHDIAEAGAAFVRLDVASQNPAKMLRNAFVLARLVRLHRSDAIHAHGRAAAWSAFLAARITGAALLTTWYKGFREQNPLKRIYNGIMARADRIVAVSDQIAELIASRYGTPHARIVVVPTAVDARQFDPSAVSAERVCAVRQAWGIAGETKAILVVGRMLRRKGHHVVVRAMQRLKAYGLKDFVCVLGGPDRERTRYGGEVWDLVLATGTADVVRFVGAFDDPVAAYAAATVVVSAATRPEGIQRGILEAQAMARPVVVSDIAVGPEVVLSPPAVPEGRMTGLRFAAADDSALASALIRLLAMPESAREAIGARGRQWMIAQFNPEAAADAMLGLYADVARSELGI